MLLLKIEWKEILLGGENWDFLPEAAFRTFVMFLVILISLRMLGKRGVKQLSVFELGVIIGLGSAAGDPMFYKDVGILPGMLVFVIVMLLYRLITFMINRFQKFEDLMEGTPTCVIKDGRILVSNFEKEPIARDELLSQLRLNSVSHLGQVDQAIIETNGEVSIYYFPDDKIRHGLPILPDIAEKKVDRISKDGKYSCIECGYTRDLKPEASVICPECHKREWVPSWNNKRIR